MQQQGDRVDEHGAADARSKIGPLQQRCEQERAVALADEDEVVEGHSVLMQNGSQGGGQLWCAGEGVESYAVADGEKLDTEDADVLGDGTKPG